MPTAKLISPIVETSAAFVATLDYSDVIRDMETNLAAATFRFQRMEFADDASIALASVNRVCEVAKSPIPDDVRTRAAQYAPQLVATMRDSVRRLARHQTAGSLDTSKLVRLARPSSPAQFDRDAATAFRARASVSREAPLKIAIVADMNWEIRKADPEYTATVNTLAFVLSDAAACAGLQCAAYGARGRMTDPEPIKDGYRNKPVTMLSRIAAYGERIRPIDFALGTDHFAYIAGFRYALGSKRGSSSVDGTGGPTYAREHDGATFVVGIGHFADHKACDVVLSPETSLHDCVIRVHAALQARNAGRRAA